jgi:hypothetical protein
VFWYSESTVIKGVGSWSHSAVDNGAEYEDSGPVMLVYWPAN